MRVAEGAARARRPVADRAVVVALLVVTSIVAVAVVAAGLVLRGAERSATESADRTARLAAAYVDAQIGGLEDLVATWTERPALLGALRSVQDGALAPETSGEGSRLAESLRLAKAGLVRAYLTDEHGVVVAVSPRTEAVLGESHADRDWFRGAVATGRPYVSEVYRARAVQGQPWVVAVSAPVLDPSSDGRSAPLIGVVAATYPVSALQQFVDEAAQAGEQLQIVDRHDVVVARSGEPGAVGRSTAGDSLTTTALAGRQGADRSAVGGADAVAAWRPVGAGGWALTVREPASSALADARRSVLVLAGLTAVLVVAVLAITVLLRRVRDRRRAAAAQVEAVRRTSEERFGALYRASPVGILEASADGTVLSVNTALAKILGHDPQQMVGSDARSYAVDDGPPEAEAAMADLVAGRRHSVTTERLSRHRDGHAVPVLVSLTAVPAPGGGVERVIAAVTDLSEARRRERALRSSEERFRTAFRASLIGMVLLDADGAVQQVNPAAEQFFGRSAAELSGQRLAALAAAADRADLAAAVRRALDGDRPRLELGFPVPGAPRRWGLLGLVATPGTDGELLVQVEDVTERRAAEQLLSRQALHDPLTSLPNRRLLLDRLEHSIASTARRADGARPALLFIDLDGFKSVNDRFGHEAGDRLLREVAARLTASVRPTDTVARLGGDEFVVLDEAAGDVSDVHALAARLLAALSAPWPPGQQLSASIGVALARPGQTAEALLRDADHAMYRAKQLGRNRYEAYDEQLRASSERRLRVERELREAMESDRMAVAFQPVVDLAGLRVTGLEALLRVRRPGGALLDAVEFIEVAEDSGLVVPLGRWVLDQACRYAAAARRDGGRWRQVAVNVSATQATRPDLEDVVLSCLAEHGVPGRELALELTETALLTAGRSTLQQLERLRAAGVQIGLDDFGTGFASLSYLAALPLDFLKVDRSFVAGLPHDRTACAIVESTVGLALRLDLRCVAEGIETPEQLAALREMGPVEGQGRLLAGPFEPHGTAPPSGDAAGGVALVW